MPENRMDSRVLEIQVLGPFEVRSPAAPVPLEGRPREVLALLTAAAGRPVRTEVILRRLDFASKGNLQSAVSRLRRALPAGVVRTVAGGYALDTGVVVIDAVRFAELVAGARTAADPDGPLTEALALWRGEPYGEFGFLAAERTRLAALHGEAVERRTESRLAAGGGAELVADLEGLLVLHPTRERLWGQLMLALYRAGRAAEAAQAYHRARAALLAEGLEPGPELVAIQRAVLAQTLAPPPGGNTARSGVGETAEEVACPYKGLARFESDDAAYFHGRDRLVDKLVAHLSGAGLVAVVGPSGSGKSSAVRAGLLPRLALGALPGSAGWRQLVVTPAATPDLAAVLPEQGRWVLFVDQFEEVFTILPAEPRRIFLDTVVAAAARGKVVLTLRADYYGGCASHRELAQLVVAAQVLVGPMSEAELAEAIEAPARQVGLTVQDGLPQALLADVRDQPGALPLLSTALLDLWEHRKGRLLTLAAYQRSGGVRGAIERLAERAYTALDERERVVARAVLLRLADSGQGAGFTRRRAALDELADPQVRRVLGLLLDRRLLIIDQETVQVAHEALLTEWPRLRGWLEADADGRAIRRHLSPAAAEWAARGRDPAELYRGARLSGALDWAGAHPDLLTEGEREFLDASAAAADRESRIRSNRRLRAMAVSLVAVLVIAAMGWTQKTGSDRARLVADVERLGSQALTEPDPALGGLLAAQAVRLDPSAAARHNLLALLFANPRLLRGTAALPELVSDTTLSGDGSRLAVASELGRVWVYDIATLRPVGPPIDAGPRTVRRISLDRDGQRLITMNRAGVPVRIWNVATATPRPLTSPAGHEPDTAVFVAGDAVAAVVGEHVELWTPEGARRLPNSETNSGLITSGDLAHLAVTTVAGRTRVIDLDGRLLGDLPTAAETQALNRDGTALLTTDIGQVILWDVRTGKQTGPVRYGSDITWGSWSATGPQVVSGDGQGRVHLWDAGTRQLLRDFPAAGRVAGAEIAEGGRTLVSVTLDGIILSWDLTGTRGFGAPTRVATGGPDDRLDGFRAFFTPDGTARYVKDGQVWEVGPGSVERPLFPVTGEDPVLAGAGGGRLAVAANDLVLLADLATGRPLLVRDILNPLAALSPDGTLLAITTQPTDTVADRPQVEIVTAAGDTLATAELSARASTMAFTPDGARLLAGLVNGTVEVLDVRTGRRVLDPLKVARGDAEVSAIGYGPDGLVAFGADDGQLSIWRGWARQRVMARTRPGSYRSVTVSPDGRYVAGSQADGRVSLHELATGQLVGASPGPYDNTSRFLVFQGESLVSVSSDRAMHRWDLDLGSARRRACAVAGRDLSPAEWAAFLPGYEYRPTC
ncbi:nSTAND1 domain-containing NTPase [Acrocarpospora catenulata]|uniref:nSTAND1 domain-containing NTPase n=1 Tax=Acrocarpospora catenulata TaxID=2836182 RepID=UPI001BD9A5B9|nr:BTAD domain-containing putative transcriptional regulator [Acrocarpospora catenulata]